ncbi:hypothetical protein NSQ90_26900 [Paenibacillus sp. FSL H7-0737]|uniref:hypothetical protein n=1 Tax=Paenibacillus sp. FSL H7-0737 TaxID=1536775 RepID=UPI0004F7830F|nr:hypothetical protein [Paenibacillus sp. FSL H7-0737]AIQ26189.1 hypothetical protein H70737_27145 [Paenibacillus sp. FSL H7-0737]
MKEGDIAQLEKLLPLADKYGLAYIVAFILMIVLMVLLRAIVKGNTLYRENCWIVQRRIGIVCKRFWTRSARSLCSRHWTS